eukprot:scaffold4.g4985.t1
MAQIAQLGRTLLGPFASVATWYNRTAEKAPFTVGVMTTGLKTSAADLFAQKVIERREHVDWKRQVIFTTFGFAYLGAFQYYLYNNLFSRMCAHLTARFGHWGTAPIKTFLDQCIHHPFVYFPCFMSMKTVMEGKPISVAAVTKYRTEIWDSVKALWSGEGWLRTEPSRGRTIPTPPFDPAAAPCAPPSPVWIPAQIVNFGVVPRHLRIPYVAAVSFGWTVIYSVMQGKFDAAAHKQLPAAADGAGEAAAPPPAGPAPAAVAAVAVASAGPSPAVRLPAVAVAAAGPSPAVQLPTAMAQPAAPIVAAAVAEAAASRR